MSEGRPYGWDEIDGIVESTLYNSPGGTPFFDRVDTELTHPYFFELLTRRLQDGMPRVGYLPPIAVSGKFGWAFSLWVKRESLIVGDLIVFPGDLRHQKLIDPQIHGPLAPEYVFIDNSMYKGRTMGQVDKFLRKYRSKLTEKWVLYDGSLPPHRTGVNYIYRWHENGIRES